MGEMTAEDVVGVVAALEGNGWQQLSESADDWGLYPAEGLQAQGTIGGRTVHCLSAELQIRFHQGYEPTSKDERDLTLLGALP